MERKPRRLLRSEVFEEEQIVRATFIDLVRHEEMSAEILEKTLMLQAITYARYSTDKEVKTVASKTEKQRDNEVAYVLMRGDGNIKWFRDSKVWGLEEHDEMLRSSFEDLLSFLKFEWGEEVEAMDYVRWKGWEEMKTIGYVASLTLNPLLDSGIKVLSQYLLHKKLYDFSESLGLENKLFTIINDSIGGFVKSSGLLYEEVAGWEFDEESKVFQRVREEFPEYWQNPPLPKLCRFIPFSEVS